MDDKRTVELNRILKLLECIKSHQWPEKPAPASTNSLNNQQNPADGHFRTNSILYLQNLPCMIQITSEIMGTPDSEVSAPTTEKHTQRWRDKIKHNFTRQDKQLLHDNDINSVHADHSVNLHLCCRHHKDSPLFQRDESHCEERERKQVVSIQQGSCAWLDEWTMVGSHMMTDAWAWIWGFLTLTMEHVNLPKCVGSKRLLFPSCVAASKIWLCCLLEPFLKILSDGFTCCTFLTNEIRQWHSHLKDCE